VTDLVMSLTTAAILVGLTIALIAFALSNPPRS
jgi:hypothetical protein